MADADDRGTEELVSHLVATSGLERQDAARVLDEVRAEPELVPAMVPVARAAAQRRFMRSRPRVPTRDCFARCARASCKRGVLSRGTASTCASVPATDTGAIAPPTMKGETMHAWLASA